MSDNAPDKEFWDLADALIAVANDRCSGTRHTKVSAAFLYAAARFNAFVAASHAQSKDEFVAQRESQIAYFIAQYEKMLRENLADYGAQFDSYTREESNRKK